MKNSFTIHDLPVSERPRERLQKMGADKLSTQELLAVILGRGFAGESVTVTAQRLLSQFGTVKGIAEASVEELTKVRGIGLAKAAQLKAVFALAGQLEKNPEHTDAPQVKTPDQVHSQVKNKLQDKKKEYFLALLLDTRSRLIKIAEISIGSLDSSIVHPREVFKEALSASAASVIFAHNHPSGDPEPSAEDIKLTKRLADAGQLMGIDVLDHVIIGRQKFFSLKREGLF
ncbi:MAG TPA: DNA repair protein RadC [Dehalococcoidales bacterium]|nr:DNA repair protein RadC [Dehalococcoidales bacterium]